MPVADDSPKLTLPFSISWLLAALLNGPWPGTSAERICSPFFHPIDGADAGVAHQPHESGKSHAGAHHISPCQPLRHLSASRREAQES